MKGVCSALSPGVDAFCKLPLGHDGAHEYTSGTPPRATVGAPGNGSLANDLAQELARTQAECDALRKDAERFEWVLTDPEGARHLLHLMQQGKGDKDSFRGMIDRILRAKNAAIEQGRGT